MNESYTSYAETASVGSSPVGAQSDVPRISQEMSLVQKRIAEARDLVTTVEQRLNAVLRPRLPQADNAKETAPQPPQSPLVNDLENYATQLLSVTRNLTDILERLEL